MEALSDVELSLLLRERVPEAHAFVFREWVRVVRSASYRILRSHDSVDDVVQRVFEELWSHPERYNPVRGPLVQYLAMQGRSRSIDLVRSEISRTRRESADQAARDRSSGALDETGELGLLARMPPHGRTGGDQARLPGSADLQGSGAPARASPGHGQEPHPQGTHPAALGDFQRGAASGASTLSVEP